MAKKPLKPDTGSRDKGSNYQKPSTSSSIVGNENFPIGIDGFKKPNVNKQTNITQSCAPPPPPTRDDSK